MNRKVLLVLLYLYAMAFSVLKTIRLPSDWAEAHWMLDYRFGFIKRGLAGEVFGWFFSKNELNIFILSAVILILLYAAIFAIAVKETFKNTGSIYRILFYLIFFLSQYMAFSAHIIGYLDHLVFLLAILVIYLIKQKKILLSSVLAAICMLVHEISFFLLLPISFFTLIVTEIPKDQFSFKSIVAPAVLKKLALFFILPLITVISVSVYQELNGENYFSKIFIYLSHTGLISEKTSDSVASAYTKSFSYYFSEESGSFFQRLFVSKCTLFYGIPILFCMLMVYKEFRKFNLSLFILLAAVALFPLLLHSIAWDTYRIWAFPFMILFLGFWVLSSGFETKIPETEKLTPFETVFFIISLLLVALIPNILFDGETERFSLIERLIIIAPLCLGVYFVIKKSQLKIS